MTRIVSVTSSRADVGILTPVWQALSDAEAAVDLLATGMHLDVSCEDSLDALPSGITVHRGGQSLGGVDAGTCVRAMSAIQTAASKLFSEIRPDAILVTGDRLDMFPATVAAVPFNLPLVHLHGGEITEGALDDRLRHAISKLAHRHCVSSHGAKARLKAMGEEDRRITITGAPGLDSLLAAPALDAERFAQETGLREIDGELNALRLVTVHPETNATDPTAAMQAVLAALDAKPAPTLFTEPNSDPGGAAMRDKIEGFVAHRPWAHFVNTLGLRLYANALRHAAMMIGNSSSGVIEAGLFGLPVIDVGDRQAGRERGRNVIHVANNAGAVSATLDRIGAMPERFAPDSPYGDGKAGPRVAEAILSLPRSDLLLRKKLAA